MTNNATSAATNIVLRAGTVTNGTQHRIELLNNVYLSDGLINLENNTVEISNYSLPKAKLYIYDACLTASNDDGTGHNLCTETISSGVDCVIGWTKPIDSVDAFSWQFRFQNKLVEGMSVKSAADYANTFSYWDNSSIKSWIIYGNQDIVVSQNEEITSSTMSTTGNSSLKHTAIQYTNYDINILKSILENEFSDFSSNDADITITYTNQKTNYVIDYYYLHNGFITESGYSIVVNNGSITHIRDNTIHSQSNTPTTYARSNMPDITSEVISSAQAQAKEHVNSIGNGYCIVEQHATKYYSITENKYYYRIMSIYVTLDGAYGATFTLYEL